MTPIVEVRPCEDGAGHLLTYGAVELWFASEVHAINYAQDLCADCDVVVYYSSGVTKHRYSSMPSTRGSKQRDCAEKADGGETEDEEDASSDSASA